MTTDKMLSEDIVQNVFLKFYESFDMIRNKESIRFWIFKTARNEVLSLIRSKKARVDQFNVKDSDEIEIACNYDLLEHIELKEIAELIISETALMPDDQKEPFLLKEYGGLSYNEISKLLNLEEGLVKSRIYKTRQKLIQKLSAIYK
jgi:RNA polymerase sigma-70 factor (ECF subfamily)